MTSRRHAPPLRRLLRRREAVAFVYRSGNPPSDPFPLVADLTFDLDGNVLGDLRELASFGLAGQAPGADPDGDGFRNDDEQRLGTDPLRGTDRPQLVATMEAGVVRLRLPAHGQSGAALRLWRSMNLAGWQAVPGRWRPDVSRCRACHLLSRHA